MLVQVSRSTELSVISLPSVDWSSCDEDEADEDGEKGQR